MKGRCEWLLVSSLSISLQELFLRCPRRISAERIARSLNCLFRLSYMLRWRFDCSSELSETMQQTKPNVVGAFKKQLNIKYSCGEGNRGSSANNQSYWNQTKGNFERKFFKRKSQTLHKIRSFLTVRTYSWSLLITSLLSYTNSLIAMVSKPPLKVATREEERNEKNKRSF